MSWFARFMDYQIVDVWHQDSPGMHVKVRRNRFQRLLYSAQFSEVGEKHLT